MLPLNQLSDTIDKYPFFASGKNRAPHWLHAYLPAWSPELDPQTTVGRLVEFGLSDAERAQPIDARDGELWRLRCGSFEIALVPSESPEGIHFQGRNLADGDIEAVESSYLTLALETLLGEDVLDDFHASLRVLDTVAPEAVAMLDVAACTLWPGAWLRSSAAASVPPPPTSMFTVHAVADPEDSTAWLHTHGLMRCGSIELELVAAPREHAGLMCNALLNVAASMFMEQGVPAPGDPFAVGQDLDLIWLPWEEALDRLEDGCAGGHEDRDENHSGASGVLFAPPVKRLGFLKGAPRNPDVHLAILEGEPLLYHSAMETRRMSMLAKEGFPTLRKLVSRFAGDEDWGFLVKLGYTVDDDEGSEHLWFEVHGIETGEIDATLVNEPYRVSRLAVGDRGKHAPDLLSDWIIYSPHGRFEPHSVEQLLELLDEPTGP